jgi:hypothetical protein
MEHEVEIFTKINLFLFFVLFIYNCYTVISVYITYVMIKLGAMPGIEIT